MTRRTRWQWATLAASAVASLAVAAAAADRLEGLDRLERFRLLAGRQLALERLVEAEEPTDAYRDLYALLDEEIVENLAAGALFASAEFLQDRLDAFAEAWGGASFRLLRADGLLVAACLLNETAHGGSVRVYGPLGGAPALLAVLNRPGRPTLHPLPGPPPGPFAAAWEGAPEGRGTRPLRVDVLRPDGAGVRTVWSTVHVFPEGLYVRAWSLRGDTLRIRYELRYPGWTPGCEGQTEAEDVYRWQAAAGVFRRVARQEHDSWHREMRATAARLFAALAAGDAAALTRLVPDTRLRARLPGDLTPDVACDAREGDRVSLAATAGGRPWAVTLRRTTAGWRLTGAGPLLLE